LNLSPALDLKPENRGVEQLTDYPRDLETLTIEA
jgi:hypothetical protein